MLSVEVFIQTLAPRAEVCRVLQDSLEASDWGSEYQLCVQRPEHDVVKHFFRVLEEMRDASADLVVRLEDDALVGKHFRHNLLTWPALHAPDFGAGWGYSPPLNVHDVYYKRRCDNPVRGRMYIPGCVAMVFWRKDMDWVIEGCRKWFEQHGGDAMDFAICEAVRLAGKLNYLADPALAEHRHQVLSALGHQHKGSTSTTLGIYRHDWKRP